MDLQLTQIDRAGAGAPTSRMTREEVAAITLDEQLCLALYTASRAMTARYRVALEESGLTYPQYLVLTLLWEESAVPVGRIGERLSLESSTLSPLLKRLEAMGLVSRTRDRSDERLMIIGLTGSGQRMQERAAQIGLDVCGATGLTGSEMSALVDRLHDLNRHLQESTREAKSA